MHAAVTSAIALAFVIAPAGCATDDAEDAGPPLGPEASTIPEVCSTVGSRARCDGATYLEPRSPTAQEDCKRGIAERRCGEARFLLEKCLDENPLCYGEDGVPVNDDAGRCQVERTRWESCEADAGP
jgi:hypothetical protein